LNKERKRRRKNVGGREGEEKEKEGGRERGREGEREREKEGGRERGREGERDRRRNAMHGGPKTAQVNNTSIPSN
jgi:hypothetical protein